MIIFNGLDISDRKTLIEGLGKVTKRIQEANAAINFLQERMMKQKPVEGLLPTRLYLNTIKRFLLEEIDAQELKNLLTHWQKHFP